MTQLKFSGCGDTHVQSTKVLDGLAIVFRIYNLVIDMSQPVKSTNMFNLRPIESGDDAQIASIIRTVLTEYGADRPGFAWQDPEVDAMTAAYYHAGRQYLVLEGKGGVIGGAGIAEFSCERTGVCELQKMYLLPEYRGLGLGKRLISDLLDRARQAGYRYCYLETLSSMTEAKGLYLSCGFTLLSQPWGNSGHNACDEWCYRALY